jgi:hypothetical protein
MATNRSGDDRRATGYGHLGDDAAFPPQHPQDTHAPARGPLDLAPAFSPTSRDVRPLRSTIGDNAATVAAANAANSDIQSSPDPDDILTAELRALAATTTGRSALADGGGPRDLDAGRAGLPGGGSPDAGTDAFDRAYHSGRGDGDDPVCPGAGVAEKFAQAVADAFSNATAAEAQRVEKLWAETAATVGEHLARLARGYQADVAARDAGIALLTRENEALVAELGKANARIGDLEAKLAGAREAADSIRQLTGGIA